MKPVSRFKTAGLAAMAACVITSTHFAQPDRVTGRPLDLAHAAAAIVVRDTLFETNEVPWEPVQGVQVVEFSASAGERNVARQDVIAEESGIYAFGIAGAGTVTVSIDGERVFDRTFAQLSRPVEYAYDRFRWEVRFTASLTAGRHGVIVEISGALEGARMFLQACDDHGMMDPRLKFGGTQSSDWQVMTAEYSDIWKPIPRKRFSDFVIKKDAVFNQHSLAEWHYANGITNLALLELSDATADAVLAKHVSNFVRFTLENFEMHRRQYEDLNAWRGANYRLFRACLLDDTSAPALPMAALVARGEAPTGVPIVEEMVDFVLKKHPRLEDGTLARDEPEPHTVWADDLFMSTSFLVRAPGGDISARIRDEVARQVQLFHGHLLDQDSGLYWHGAYAARNEVAPFHWGRANGWIAWAMSEALQFLPRDHAEWSNIARIHRQQMRTLIRLQSDSGLWHQILDRPESYEETSATAMFLIAMVRGTRNGWLEANEFEEPIRRAWEGLRARVNAAGVVHGICRGTGIGDTMEYYLKRPTRDHDPRGLGAFVVAAIEMDAWLESR